MFACEVNMSDDTVANTRQLVDGNTRFTAHARHHELPPLAMNRMLQPIFSEEHATESGGGGGGSTCPGRKYMFLGWLSRHVSNIAESKL